VRLYVDYHLTESEVNAFSLEPSPDIVEWVEKNIRLESGYTNSGRVRLKKWQKDPLMSFHWAKKIILLGPVQTGKSFLADMMLYYTIAIKRCSGMVVYGNEKIVRRVFKRRIKPMIQKNPSLSRFWSGKDDDLAIDNIQLGSAFWGVASAQNRNDIATFPAGVVIWSEVSKAEKVDFDPMLEIKGRQEAYPPDDRRVILESSPNNPNDLMYPEIFRPGTVIMRPNVSCVFCGKKFVMEDRLIKMSNKYQTKNPHKIRVAGGDCCFLECPHCGGEIKEQHHARLINSIEWMANEMAERVSDSYTWSQSEGENPKTATAVCWSWNRLVDINYTFSECLARFFEAKKNTVSLATYNNNDMARFYRKDVVRVQEEILRRRAENSEYFSKCGDKLSVPHGVIALLLGIDTQDDGFWFVVQGVGKYLESWILRYGFINCSIDEVGQDYDRAFEKISEVIFGVEYFGGVNNSPMTIAHGFMDRGGHRPQLVDRFCSRTSQVYPYIGAVRDDPKKDLVYDTGKGFYYGKTELLSDLVGDHMRRDDWHLPHDVDDYFIKQVTRQYHYDDMDRNGNVKRKWKHGGNDHLRDCLNMIYGGIIFLNLDTTFYSEDGVKNVITNQKTKIDKDHKQPEQKSKPSRSTPVRRASTYFGGGRY
jgi:phage terminase large subunit GpA-like protein